MGAGRGDAALIALAAKTGARREEICKITLADMTPRGEFWTLCGIGKGNKKRTLYCDNGAYKALNVSLAVRGNAPGALFVGIAKGSKIGSKGLTTTAAHKILVKRADDAGLKAISWHDFRRTFAGGLLSAGEDVATVAQ